MATSVPRRRQTEFWSSLYFLLYAPDHLGWQDLFSLNTCMEILCHILGDTNKHPLNGEGTRCGQGHQLSLPHAQYFVGYSIT